MDSAGFAVQCQFITVLAKNMYHYLLSVLLLFSHFWLATVQDVLQADWQEAWHSPQPAPIEFFAYVVLLSVFTFFIFGISFRISFIVTVKLNGLFSFYSRGMRIFGRGARTTDTSGKHRYQNTRKRQ